MLGFIVTGLKLVGKIIVKAVKAAVVGAVVGCVSSKWKDLKNTTDEILDRTVKEVERKRDELAERVEKEDENFKLTWKEKVVIFALIIKWITATTYGIILGAMTCVAYLVDAILKGIAKIIFKSNKEEENLCSE